MMVTNWGHSHQAGFRDARLANAATATNQSCSIAQASVPWACAMWAAWTMLVCIANSIGAPPALSPSALSKPNRSDTILVQTQVNRQEKPLLSDQQFAAIEEAMDRGLRSLNRYRQENGRYSTRYDVSQPGITSLCVMAYLSRGHLPGSGPHGDHLNESIDFVISCQHANGLLAETQFGADVGPRSVEGNAAPYNHSISGLLLAEIYGMTNLAKEKELAAAVRKAIDYTVQCQYTEQDSPIHSGGWGYLPVLHGADIDDNMRITDLSVVSWQIMFLRAAKNAGFDVPAATIDRAMAYVERHFDEKSGVFYYRQSKPNMNQSMAGVGIVMLSLGGKQASPKVISAGEWLLRNPWSWNDSESVDYSAYYCSQAALQLGEPYWSRIYSPILDYSLRQQRPDGSWPASSVGESFGQEYTTALMILSLGAPLQLLPIYQP